MPLRMIQNWFPGKLIVENDGPYTLSISGAAATILLLTVAPLSKRHVVEVPTEQSSIEFQDIGIGSVSVESDDDAYLMGYGLACAGHPTSSPIPLVPHHGLFSTPGCFAHTEVVLLCLKDPSVPVLTLNRIICSLQRILVLACPEVPHTLVVDRQPTAQWTNLCHRSRQVREGVRAMGTILNIRPRRTALSEEHQECIDRHAGVLGITHLSRLLSLPRGQVAAYVEAKGVPTPRGDPITEQILKCTIDRDFIRFHIQYMFGVRLTTDAIRKRQKRAVNAEADTSNGE